MRLVKGLRLGMVTPVDLVPDVDKCGADGEGSTCGETEDGEVWQLELATSSGRGNQQLKLELDHLTYLEQQKVKTLLTSYADIFALSTNELGTTDIVLILKDIHQSLPRIDDILDLLAGYRYFTTLDLASGYWQVNTNLRKCPSGWLTHPPPSSI